MSKKVISIVLSAAMLVAMLCVGFGAVTASAADTFTYYFLAPDNYFKTEAGASNTSVGVYWWQPSQVAAWPGIEMTAAPEVGENVFKIEAPNSDECATVIFNAFVDAGNPADPALAAVAHQTVNVNTEGYDANEGYDGCPAVDNFNGMIYVLANDDEHKSVNDYSGAITTEGAWFSLDTYKDNATYYGSYGFTEDTTDTTPADTDSETPAPSTKTKYHAGDTATVSVMLGSLSADAPYLGAYNYNINYDTSKVEIALKSNGKPDAKNLATVADEDAPQPTLLANTDTAGTVKLAYMAAEGADANYSGDNQAIYTIKFNVIADTDDLGITGECTSLTAIVADKSSTTPVVGVDNLADGAKFTDLAFDVECPHPDEPDTDSSEPTPIKPADNSSKPADNSSKPADNSSKSADNSSKANSSATSSKATGDNASSKNTSSGKGSTTSTATSTATVQTAGTFAVVSLVVILMAAAAVVLYTRKKTEE